MGWRWSGSTPKASRLPLQQVTLHCSVQGNAQVLTVCTTSVVVLYLDRLTSALKRRFQLAND
jgi:hypothetical protein